jgi:hypothetical protein
MSGTRLTGALLFGVAFASVLLVVARSNLNGLVSPLFIAAAVFLLLRSSGRSSPRFPSTTLERGLEQLFALLIPRPKATTSVTVLAAMQRYVIVTGLRRNARRWITELQSISTDGYETASSISSRFPGAGDHDSRTLVEEAVRVLRAERASAGADLALASDPVTVLAYGLGARPADADLRSLEELLDNLGFAGEGEELRAHFDDVIAAETDRMSRRLKAPEERHTFRDLAGASFVLGASTRIVELASPPSTRAALAR